MGDDSRRDYRTASSSCSNPDNCWTMTVTGHSLGGGLASIVGTTLGIKSVAFSGPGLLFSKDQQTTEIDGNILKPDLASAIELSTNFIPTRDPVPRVDDHI